jgi:hypothetical protein
MREARASPTPGTHSARPAVEAAWSTPNRRLRPPVGPADPKTAGFLAVGVVLRWDGRTRPQGGRSGNTPQEIELGYREATEGRSVAPSLASVEDEAPDRFEPAVGFIPGQNLLARPGAREDH